jgi:hypothetical protein
MKLEVFNKIIESIQNQEKRSHEAYRLGIDLINYDVDYTLTIDLLFKAYYGEEGADWISWFLYERDSLTGGEPNAAWDANGDPICFDVPSLWKYVEELRCSNDFKEYELTEPSGLSFELLFGKSI